MTNTRKDLIKAEIEKARNVADLCNCGGMIRTSNPQELTDDDKIELETLREEKRQELKREESREASQEESQEESREEKRARLWKELSDLLDESEVELDNGMTPDELDDITDADQLRDEFAERQINDNSEIIYYSRAMDYLAENDASLTRSLELAKEFGYDVDDLNSEKLASLLNYQENCDTYHANEGQINDILDERQETLNEDEDEPEEMSLAEAGEIIAENLAKMHENL